MKAKVMGGHTYVTTDVSYKVAKSVIRDVETLKDAEGNDIMAIAIDFDEVRPLQENAIIFNAVHDNKLCIAMRMSDRIMQLDKPAQKQAVTEVLAQYWDKIELAVNYIETVAADHDATVSAVADLVEVL